MPGQLRWLRISKDCLEGDNRSSRKRVETGSYVLNVNTSQSGKLSRKSVDRGAVKRDIRSRIQAAETRHASMHAGLGTERGNAVLCPARAIHPATGAMCCREVWVVEPTRAHSHGSAEIESVVNTFDHI